MPVSTFREKVQQIVPALLLIDKLIFILLAPVRRVLIPALIKLPAAPIRKVIFFLQPLSQPGAEFSAPR